MSTPSTDEAAPAPLRKRLDTESPWVINAGRLILLIALFALWEIGGGWLFDTFYFSKPSLIARAFATDLGDPAFYTDLATTGLELVLGYVSGGVSGIALGILLARWRFVGKLCDPFLLALNSVPRIAVAPMLIVWFGIGIASKVFLAGTLVFFITFFNTLSGIRGVDKALCDVARVQGATEWQIFTKVILENAGSSLDRLVAVHAGIYDRIEYDVLNRVYRQYVPNGPPARTVWSIQIIDGFKVQIDAVAVV